MSRILVVAPHPDDETLGCGGTLLKHRKDNDEINWLIMTEMKPNNSNRNFIEKRNNEIKKVKKIYDFETVIQADCETAMLDSYNISEIINFISMALDRIKPNIVYIPYANDVHSDHKIISEAFISSSKAFRKPFITSIRAYETLSETEFNIDSTISAFKPNLFINIEKYLEKKIKIMNIYKSEVSKHPFPRSEKSLRSLAYLRGSSASLKAAESFIILKEIK